MKSHEFAQQLILMAKVLKSGPDVEIRELEFSKYSNISMSHKPLEKKDIPKALSLLVGLNDVNKSQWVQLIHDFDFEIEIRPRDANRDIIGKLLNYLSSNPEARDKLSGKELKKSAKSSSELADALSILLT